MCHAVTKQYVLYWDRTSCLQPGTAKCKRRSEFERYSKTSLLEAETKHNIYLRIPFPHRNPKMFSFLTTVIAN